MQDIARRTIDKCYRSFLGDEGVDSFINTGESDRELRKHIGHCDIALRENAIVAFSIYFDDLIHLMMVDVGQHRTGIGKVVDAFKGIAFVEGNPPEGAPRKLRAMLRDNVPPLDSKINFTDIGKVVDAFKTIAYAEDGPTACP